MSKSENERCVEDNECQGELVCLSGICKDPNSSLAKLSDFQKGDLERVNNLNNARIEEDRINREKELKKAELEELQKQLKELENEKSENEKKIKQYEKRSSQDEKKEKSLLKARKQEMEQMKSHERDLIRHTIDEEAESKNAECPICFQPLYPFEKLIFCNNNHPIHASCFMGMYQSNIGRRTEVVCPIARCSYSPEVMQYARASDQNVTTRQPRGQQIIDPDTLSMNSDSDYSDSDANTIDSDTREESELEIVPVPFRNPETGNVMRTFYYNDPNEGRNVSRHGNFLSDDSNRASRSAVRRELRNMRRRENEPHPEDSDVSEDEEAHQISAAVAAARQALARHPLNNFESINNMRYGISNRPSNRQSLQTIDDAINFAIAERERREAEMAERIRSQQRRRRQDRNSQTRNRSPQPGGKKTKRKWSKKYKKSINCKRPKGFSQKQYCKYGRKTRRK